MRGRRNQDAYHYCVCVYMYASGRVFTVTKKKAQRNTTSCSNCTTADAKGESIYSNNQGKQSKQMGE